MAGAAREQLFLSLQDLLTSGAHSDLTITCGSEIYKVHKNIVCSRADFFARAIKFGGKETQGSNVDLPEDDPEIIKQLIRYLYEGEYSPVLPDTESTRTARFPVVKLERPTAHSNGCEYSYEFPHSCSTLGPANIITYLCPHHVCRNYSNWQEVPKRNFVCEECKPSQPKVSLYGTSYQLLLHAKMYEMADKYDVVGLKALVAEKFSRACMKFWNDANFSIAAHHAFSSTPDHDKGLRDIVSATISAHMELMEKPAVKVLLTEFNGLALGILEDKVKEHGWGKKKK